MDTTKKKVFTSSEFEKNVFIINDIDLMIPPQQIEVRKEDLTYRYRTLRTKQATKVPTGSGQVSIKTSMVFTDDQILQLHRLLTEVRSSPFCYVDNRYLRESLVPDWPYSQNMAFTVTGLNVSNLPNTSNAYMLEMDYIWFNYFPYMHNYLFREDWQTNWLRSTDSSNKTFQSNTIGWKLNHETYQKVYGPNIIGQISMSSDEVLARRGINQLGKGSVSDKYSTIQDKFIESGARRTIYEMEARHPGIEFDLLPTPGNMMPSNIVNQPRHSRIYVRYINFLQRDALWKNFEIDVEADIIAYEEKHGVTGLYKSVFGVGEDEDGLPTVISLASAAIPRSLRQAWIKKIVQHNDGINLHFHTYKEIRLPQKWVDNVENKKNKVVADLFNRIQAMRQQISLRSSEGEGAIEAIPVFGRKYPITSDYGYRIHPIHKRQHLHTGVDFGAPRGTPVLAPESGYVVHVGKGHSTMGNYIKFRTPTGAEWWFLHLDLIDPRTETAFNSYRDDPTLAITVPAGRQLGTVGSTGGTTGAHLHLEYHLGGAHTYPHYRLQELAAEAQAEKEPEPIIDTEPYYDYSDMPNMVELSDEDFTLMAAKEEARTKLELSSEETEAITDLMTILDSEGWSYYDEDPTVTNVWKKLFSLQVSHTGRDRILNGEYPKEFAQAGIVLTGISGGYQHLVARIPVLSHEFPTQQHLGSMEPEYMMEFAVIDDQSDLEGISSMGQLVQSMRSILQSNSRKFRPIVDGWCLAVDTFITRLLGTYNDNDFRVLEDGGKIIDIDLKKRAIINNTYDGTVPGNPGLSLLTMNIQETNPYELEKLVATAPTLIEKEQAREKVLRAVKNLMIDPEYKDFILPLFFAQKAGANLTDSSRPDYGIFALPKQFGGIPKSSDFSLFTYRPLNGPDKYTLLLQSNSPQEKLFLERVGIETSLYEQDEDFLALNPEGLDNYYLGYVFHHIDPSRPTYFRPDPAPGVEIPFDPADVREFSSYLGYNGQSYDLYNISALLEKHPVTGTLPIDQLMEYYILIEATIQTGCRMLAEEALGGIADARIKEELYNLPVFGEMWRSWLLYVEEFAKVSHTSSAASALTQVRETASKSLRTAAKGRALEPLPDWKRADFVLMAQQGYGIGGTKIAGAWDYLNFISDNIAVGAAAVFSSQATVVANQKGSHNTALSRLVHRYMSNFPIQIWLPDKLKESYKYVFGDFLTEGLQKFEATVDSYDKKFEALHNQLYVSAFSVGNITSYALAFKTSLHAGVHDTPVWEYTTKEVDGKFRIYHSGIGGVGEQVAAGIDQSLPGVIANTALQGLFSYDPAADVGNATGNNVPLNNLPSYYGNPPTMQDIQAATTNQFFYMFPFLKDALYSDVSVGARLGSEFKFPVDPSVEEQKLLFVKGALDKIGDQILSDYRVLELLGLEHLLTRDGADSEFVGSECYPDLELPAHPYYGTTLHTYPDFYYWNIYEDADALGPEVLKKIQEQVNYVVHNAYQSMKKLSSATEKYDERQEAQLQETGVADPIVLSTEINPEGTDEQRDGTGPTDSLFAKTKGAEKASKNFNDLARVQGVASRVYGEKPKDYIEGIRLANTEGLYGTGGGVHYPRRVGGATYGHLKEQFDKTTSIFGSQMGYLGQEINERTAPTIHSATKGTNLSQPVETAQTFDEESLKLLARDSAKDMMSQKMSMKRAFPTFKLFFIEEDEFESRFINFDDFYAYNAVKRIDVVQSRKIAADTAIITLQNIAGTLDGTKRNIVTDLDYASGAAKERIEAAADGSSNIADDPVTSGTASEQPFGAVILRPGLNVQLRMGFSNDPSNLHVMLSGRIVDVVWNKTGDLAEITVQSFGTELAQIIKGTMRDDNSRTFYTTHELLGSMMLEPEIVHFGRWEFGQKFMIGEAKDHRLDFTDYARDGYLGRLPVTSWVSRWIVDHPVMTTGLAIGASLVSTFFPFGRMASWFGTLTGAGSGLARFGAGAVGSVLRAGGSAAPFIQNRAGYISMGTRIARSFGRGTDDAFAKAAGYAATKKAVYDAATNNLDELAKIARNRLGGAGSAAAKEFDDILRAKRASLASRIAKASNLDEAAEAFFEIESYVQGVIGKSRWFAKPWVQLSGANFLSAAGFKPLGTFFNFFVGAPLAIAGATFGSALAVDALINAVYSTLSETRINAMRRFFARTRIQMFLTPQDDNLYPPHPKDYMSLDRKFSRRLIEYGLHVGSMITTRSDEFGKQVGRFIFPTELISKKVEVEAAQYQIVSSTIWDIFHEMSLRHPGWIYAARPYGNKFRYTMFFGIPAQRYWARPATNGFILRANDLRRYLDTMNQDSEYPISESEFIHLYGREAFKEIKELSENEIVPPESKTGLSYAGNDIGFSEENDNLFGGPTSDTTQDLQALEAADAEERVRKAVLQQNMAAVALAEYLRAVQIRFEPFRRYHMLTSDRDIVWNGLMGSENAVANAVDVSYFTDTDHAAYDSAGSVQTAVFKAHAFIPEHKLRIAPVRWYNCKGYGMAQRYAMGELLHRLRDMYRGEILVLGNPRIRPWDIGILIDEYNDMVGPIEVEQVVHTFSHETGYLTEIKPSAVCFANEISGFPLVEAMKLFSLAINDIHKRFTGITSDTETATSEPRLGKLAEAANILGDLPGKNAAAVAGTIAAGGLGYNLARRTAADDSRIYHTFLQEKYEELFPGGASFKNMYGSTPPAQFETIDGLIDDVLETAKIGGHTVGIAGAALTLAGGLTGIGLLGKESFNALGNDIVDGAFTGSAPKSAAQLGMEVAKVFKKHPLGLAAAGAGVIAGLGLASAGTVTALAINQMQWPGTAFLFGGTALFLQCLRNDAIIVVPLIKNGYPIIAGLGQNDPAMLWNTLRGTINRTVHESIEGTTDMLSLYKKYYDALWERAGDVDLFGAADVELTGEVQ